MFINEHAQNLIENIHTLEDSEIINLFTSLMVEMDRRFIDIEDAYEDGQEIIEHQYDDEEEYDTDVSIGEFEQMCEDAYDHADREGW